MKKTFESSDFFGKIEIFEDDQKRHLLVKPSGIINPNLVKLDLVQAKLFGEKMASPWTYEVDTSKVIFANPLNLFWLRKVRKLPHIKEYIIYAPHPHVKLLLKLAAKYIGVTKIKS